MKPELSLDIKGGPDFIMSTADLGGFVEGKMVLDHPSKPVGAVFGFNYSRFTEAETVVHCPISTSSDAIDYDYYYSLTSEFSDCDNRGVPQFDDIFETQDYWKFKAGLRLHSSVPYISLDFGVLGGPARIETRQRLYDTTIPHEDIIQKNEITTGTIGGFLDVDFHVPLVKENSPASVMLGFGFYLGHRFDVPYLDSTQMEPNLMVGGMASVGVRVDTSNLNK
jgi:hypothetical protein